MSISLRVWAKIGIGILFIMVVSLVVVYQLKLQQTDKLESELANLQTQVKLLENPPMLDLESLQTENTELQSSINSEINELGKVEGTKSFTELVGLARANYVTLIDTRSLGVKTVNIEKLPYEILSLKLQVGGGAQDMMDFIQSVSDNLGVITNLEINIPGNGGDNFTADFQVDIYSYKERG